MIPARSLGHASRRAFSSAAPAFPQYVLNAPATEVSTVGNGLRVASESSDIGTATVGVFIDSGSRYETAKNNGVAHFLEHMAFKGTSKRSQQQLEIEIENMGGHLNAYTSREQTVYYAKVFKEDVPKAMDILSDILTNATFDPAAIDRERDVILREMQEVEKEQEEVIFDRLHETAFMGNGLGRTILGPVENILSLSRDDLTDFIQTHYTAPRVVVAGAGGVEHAALAELADKHFGSLPKESPKGPVVMEPAYFTGSEIRIRNDAQGIAHVALAVESAGYTSEHAFPLMVMQTILGSWSRTSGSGGNIASKMCNQLAETESCHSVMSFNSCYKDTGLFGVYGIGEAVMLNDMMFYITEGMARLCHRVTDEEVERARTQLKATMLAHLDSTANVCEDIGRQMLTYNRRMTPAEIFARIDAVDAKAVMATAGTFINDQDCALAASGPIWELPDYNFLRRRMYWNSI